MQGAPEKQILWSNVDFTFAYLQSTDQPFPSPSVQRLARYETGQTDVRRLLR